MPFFIPQYDSLRIHEMMLLDSVRTATYQSAIDVCVKPGDVVLDIGTGTGVLAMFAARAGAGRVYAIEPTGVIELAERLAKRNGLASRIEFIGARVEEISLPEKADCIVSEWMGVFALQENMLPSIASARDRLLKARGKMLPEGVRLFVALVEDRSLHDSRIGCWQRRPYGLDYSDFAVCQANDVHAVPIAPEMLLSGPAEIARLDLQTVRDSQIGVQVALTAARDGVCHGLAGWFQAQFPEGIVLDTAPTRPLTHWNQVFFPALDPVPLRLGEEVAVKLSAEPQGALVHFSWEVGRPSCGQPSFSGDTRKLFRG